MRGAKLWFNFRSRNTTISLWDCLHFTFQMLLAHKGEMYSYGSVRGGGVKSCSCLPIVEKAKMCVCGGGDQKWPFLHMVEKDKMCVCGGGDQKVTISAYGGKCQNVCLWGDQKVTMSAHGGRVKMCVCGGEGVKSCSCQPMWITQTNLIIINEHYQTIKACNIWMKKGSLAMVLAIKTERAHYWNKVTGKTKTNQTNRPHHLHLIVMASCLSKDN